MATVFDPNGPPLSTLSIEELEIMTAQTLSLLRNTPTTEEETQAELIRQLNILRTEQASRVGGVAEQPTFLNPILFGLPGILATETDIGRAILGELSDITEQGITDDQNIVERLTNRTLNLIASPVGGTAEGIKNTVAPFGFGVSFAAVGIIAVLALIVFIK